MENRYKIPLYSHTEIYLRLQCPFKMKIKKEEKRNTKKKTQPFRVIFDKAGRSESKQQYWHLKWPNVLRCTVQLQLQVVLYWISLSNQLLIEVFPPGDQDFVTIEFHCPVKFILKNGEQPICKEWKAKAEKRTKKTTKTDVQVDVTF